MDDISIKNRSEEVAAKMKKMMDRFVNKTCDELLGDLIEAHEEQIKMIQQIRDRGEYKTKIGSVIGDLLLAVGIAKDGWPEHNKSVKDVIWTIEHEVKNINSVMGKYDLVNFLIDGK